MSSLEILVRAGLKVHVETEGHVDHETCFRVAVSNSTVVVLDICSIESLDSLLGRCVVDLLGTYVSKGDQE